MHWITYVATVTLIFVAGLYYYVKKKYSFFEEHEIPHVKPEFPLGNLSGVGSKFHMFDFLKKLYKELEGKGSIVGFYNILDPIYLVTDIELIKTIIVKDFNNFVNRGAYYNEDDDPLSAHLFAIEDDRWRFIRNKLSPVFTSGKLKSMYHTINGYGNNLVNTINRNSNDGKSIDIKNVANRFTVDIISSCAFGMDANTLNDEHPELLEIFKDVFGADGPKALYFAFLFSFPNLSKRLKLRLISKKTSAFFTTVVDGNIKYREETNDTRHDFLNMLIQLKNKGSIDGEFSSETKKLTLNECLAQAFIFFFAGADTSSTTLSFALAELAFNLDIQEKLRDEILEKTKETKGDISYEILQEMPYLNQVVSETLRMYTPGFALFRKSSEDFKVPDTNITIKKGYGVWIPSIGLHYDEKYWKNPTKFDPERFSQEEIAKRPAQCYLPFGDGPRNCIGMRFGLVNVKCGLAMIIKNFKVTPYQQLEYPLKINPKIPQLEPVGGFLLNFEKI